MRDLLQNIQATMEGRPHRCWVTPTHSETQHYNMLGATYCKTSEQLQKVINTVGNVQCSCQEVLWNRFQGLISHVCHTKHEFVGTFF